MKNWNLEFYKFDIQVFRSRASNARGSEKGDEGLTNFEEVLSGPFASWRCPHESCIAVSDTTSFRQMRLACDELEDYFATQNLASQTAEGREVLCEVGSGLEPTSLPPLAQ